MNNKKSKITAAIVVVFVSFISIGYFSCGKTGPAQYCDGVSCQNGGYCLKGQCMCPTGFEDSTCSTAVVSKYTGTWTVSQTIVSSDSSKLYGHDSVYSIVFKNAATPTSFFIYNFLNNNEYNELVCSISGTNSNYFSIDTATNAAMRFDHVGFTGGTGTLYLAYFPTGDRHPALDTIKAGFVYSYINAVVNRQTDTIRWVLYNHQP